jgi:acetyl-CoA acyltransferase
MRSAVIVDAVRTASGKGKPGGALSGTHPVELYANVLAALVVRTGLDPARVDDVITGCVAQVGQQSLNIGRQGVLATGGRYGLQTMCEGGGMANATIIERI